MDEIESIAVTPNPTDNFDELYMVVNRPNGRFIESLSLRMKPVDVDDLGEMEVNLDDQIFMDSALTFENTNIVNSLGHLNGQEVSILADGVVLDRQTVDSSAITLEATYSLLHVGVPYNSDFETLSIEVNE